MIKIGVLALQGAFIEHEKMLASLGAESFEIRQLKDIGQPMDGLIIPGGFFVFGVLIAVVNKITKGKAISKKEFGCANCPSRGACLENPENTGSAKEAK